MNRILKCNDHFWRADVCWRNSIAEADQQQCVFLLQQHAWKILNAHLNGGLGNGWWQYPLVVTTSSITRQMAMSLVGSWKTFAETFSFDSPYKGVDRNISVESILAIHYQNIEEFFAPKDFGDTNTEKKFTKLELVIKVDKRNARKNITYLTGWELEIDDLKAHMKNIKKKYGCNGSVKKKVNKIIFLLQGDKSKELIEYLKTEHISDNNIKLIS